MQDLTSSRFYTNRELSWLEFNHRVFEVAQQKSLPLLERLKFLCIFYSNLDEFFMVRVGRIVERCVCGNDPIAPDGILPSKLIQCIRRNVLRDQVKAEEFWKKELRPALAQKKLAFKPISRLSGAQKKFLAAYFRSEVIPVITPRDFEGEASAQIVVSREVNFIVSVEEAKKVRYVWFAVPTNLPKILYVPRGRVCEKSYGDIGHAYPGSHEDLVLIEELIRANLPAFFKSTKILSSAQFRITRNTKLAIDEEEDDVLLAVRDLLERRRYSEATRLEVPYRINRDIYTILKEAFRLPLFKIYRIKGPMAFCNLMSVYSVDLPQFKYRALNATVPQFFTLPHLFERLRKQDEFVYHPYDNFSTVISFIRQAAEDPQVKAIYQTIYRVSSVSPVIDALMQAKRNGKNVTVVVELKARFDEERNISWGEGLAALGVHVVYSPNDLKIHAKMCLVEREEEGKLVRYAHLATGNYNVSTARLYCDIGLFTANPVICEDARRLFDVVIHATPHPEYKELLVSPVGTRAGILKLINEETEYQRLYGDGAIDMKCNQLVDAQVIRALYTASQAGVKIRLQVRGATSLRPGIKGVSETITLNSIVGRFLEHARIYRFHAHGKNITYIGSADMMGRNLDRRIEVLLPIKDENIKNRIDGILDTHLKDNVQAWELKKQGEYCRLSSRKAGKLIDSQQLMIKNAKKRFVSPGFA